MIDAMAEYMEIALGNYHAMVENLPKGSEKFQTKTEEEIDDILAADAESPF